MLRISRSDLVTHQRRREGAEQLTALGVLVAPVMQKVGEALQGCETFVARQDSQKADQNCRYHIGQQYRVGKVA